MTREYIQENGIFIPSDLTLNECIERLEKRNIDRSELILSSYSDKQKWKTMINFHLLAWVYRITELARDIKTLITNERFNTAWTCTRPFLEAIIIFTDYLRRAKNAIDQDNDKEIALLFITIFSRTKHEEFLDTQCMDVSVDPHMEVIKIKYGINEEEYIKALKAPNNQNVIDSLSEKTFF